MRKRDEADKKKKKRKKKKKIPFSPYRARDRFGCPRRPSVGPATPRGGSRRWRGARDQ